MSEPAWGSLAFREQIAFFLQKTNLPTATWRDIWQAAHDRAFVVAGAMQADLLNDLRMAVQKGIDQGTTLAEFRKDFEVIVAHHGWTGWTGEDTAAGRAWRTRVIYETNLRTSYAAGRWAQLQAAGFPYLRYRHNDNVTVPREDHLSWDGLILAADDPWWETHATPNGWGCQCWIEGVSEREMKRLGRDGPDSAPTAPDDLTGIDEGWAYAPGASVAQDLGRFLRDKLDTLPQQIAQDLAEAVTERLQQPPEQPTPPWTMLQGKAATLEEIKALGRERLDELLSLVVPDDVDTIKVMAFRGRTALDVLKTETNGDLILPWLREELLSRLRAARDVGGARFALTNQRGKGVALSRRVSDKLPTSWVEKVNAKHKPYHVKANESGRGWHNAWSREIQTSSGSTAEHEWAHAVQAADPVLDALFQAEHRRRTEGDPLEWLGPGYAKGEVARKDGYVEPYQGKEYEGRGALEVITMSMQAVLGEDRTANRLFKAMVTRDEAMLELTLGTLFHYQPD